MYKEAPVSLSPDFLAEIFQAIEVWDDILSVLKEENSTKNMASGKTVFQKWRSS